MRACSCTLPVLLPFQTVSLLTCSAVPLSLHRGSPVFMPRCLACPQSEQGLGRSVCFNALSPGGAGLPVCTAAPRLLCQGHPCMWVPQCFVSSILSSGEGASCVQRPTGMQSCSLISPLDQSLGGGPLYARCGALLMLLDLVPGEVAEDTCQCPAGRLGNPDGAPTGSLHSGEM